MKNISNRTSQLIFSLLFVAGLTAFVCSAWAYTIDGDTLTIGVNERVYTSALEDNANNVHVLSNNGIKNIVITNSGSQLFFPSGFTSDVEDMDITYYIKGTGWNKELNGAIRLTYDPYLGDTHKITNGRVILTGDAEIWTYGYGPGAMAIPIDAKDYNLTIKSDGHQFDLTGATITGTDSSSVNVWYVNNNDVVNAASALSGYTGTTNLVYSQYNGGPTNHTAEFSSCTNNFKVTIESGTRLCVYNQAELGPATGVTVSTKDTGQLWIGRDSVVGSEATAATNKIQITGSKWGTKEDNGAIRLEGKLYAAISLTGNAKISTVNKNGYLYGTIDTSGKQLTLETHISDAGYGSTYLPMEVNSVISGTGSIIKTGAGTVTINSNINDGNSYTGGTTVNAGTLVLTGKNMGYSSIGTGDLVINSGAKVQASSHNVFGSGDTSRIPNVTINSGTLVPYQYLHIKSVALNSGTIESHGSTGTGLDFNKYNGSITSTGTSYIKSAIQNTSTLSIDVKSGTLNQSGYIVNTSTLNINVESGAKMSVTNYINNSGTGSKLVKTGAGSLQTSNWINNNVEINGGDITLTGSFGSNSKRFNGTITVNSGAKLICATQDTLGWGNVYTNMYLYGGSLESTVKNETLGYFNIYLKGGSINGAAEENAIHILLNSVKYYSEAADGATAENPTVSYINAYTNLRCTGAFAVDTAENTVLKFTKPIINGAGDGTITKTGKGVMELTAQNTTGGAITVSDGTLKFSESGTYAGNIVDNATVEFAQTGDISYSKQISGSGKVVKTGTGTLTLSYAKSSYTGGTSIEKGTVILNTSGGNGTTALGTGDIYIGSDATLILQNANALSSTSTLTIEGTFTPHGYTNIGSIILNNGTVTQEYAIANQGMCFGTDKTITATGTSSIASIVSINGSSSSPSLQIDVTGEADTLTISGQIVNNKHNSSAVGAINKTGSGTLILEAQNSYTAGTTISGGVLKLTKNGTLGSGNITNNATLEFAHDGNLSLSNKITGSGKVTKTGTGTLTLTCKDSTYAGGTSIESGTVILKTGTNGSTPLGTGDIYIAPDATLVLQSANLLSKTSTLTIEGTFTPYGYTNIGSIILNNGTVTQEYVVANQGMCFGTDKTITATGTSSIASMVSINGSSTTSPTLQIDVTGEDDTLTISGPIVNNHHTTGAVGAINKTGLGTLILEAENSYSAGTTISGGVLKLTKNGTLGTGSVTLDGGTLEIDSSSTIKSISGSGDVIMDSGSVTVSESLNQTSGVTTITAGELKLTKGGTVYNLSGSGSLQSGADLTINVSSDVTSLFDGKLSVAGSTITKLGTGTLQLYGTETDPIEAKSFNHNAGRLDMKGYYKGSFMALTDTVFSPGNSVGTLTVLENTSKDGVVAFNAGSTLLFEQDATGMDQLLLESGNELTVSNDAILELVMGTPISGATYMIIENGSDFQGDYANDSFWNSLLTPGSDYYWNLSVVGNKVFAQIDPNAVPEPSTWALLILGMAGLMKVASCELRVARKRNERR